MGASFLVWGISYLIYDVPFALLGEPGIVPYSFASRMALAAGTVIFAYFFRRVFSATWDKVTGAGEIGSVLMIWLAFFAPAFYRRWVDAAEPAVQTAGDRDTRNSSGSAP